MRILAASAPILWLLLGGCNPVEPKYDSDGDGYTDDVDCAPEDLFSGAMSTFYDDNDGDGYGSEVVKACTLPEGAVEVDGDCDDQDAGVNPGAAEIWYDGYDQNCDGIDDDQDGDGWYITDYPYDVPEAYADHQGDCYDDPAQAGSWVALNGFPNPGAVDVYPGAPEVYYDGLDEDCMGGSDFDLDGDGYGAMGYTDNDGVVGTDCDDADPEINPRASDYWYDGVDSNCSGNNDYDKDRDGYGLDGSGDGTDCNDDDDAINPSATEVCDRVDNDCDGQVDEVCRTGS